MEQAVTGGESPEVQGNRCQSSSPGMGLTLPMLAVTWGYLFGVVMVGWTKGYGFFFAIALFCLVGWMRWQAEKGGMSLVTQCLSCSALIVGIVANLAYLFIFCEKQYAMKAMLALPLLVLAMLVGFSRPLATEDRTREPNLRTGA